MLTESKEVKQTNSAGSLKHKFTKVKIITLHPLNMMFLDDLADSQQRT